MSWLSGDKIFERRLTKTIYEETQVEAREVSLTAAAVYELTERGELDFGGSEFKAAGRREIRPKKRSASDDYGWWELEEGDYLLELNEQLSLLPEETAVIEPHNNLLKGGATQPGKRFSGELDELKLILPLRVPAAGLAIKENARTTSLRVLKAS